jgi:SAM-dependent methyltransferase
MITEEGQRLSQHWNALGSEALDSYLIQEVEHPAYNPQSVLMRSFLINRLWAHQHESLVEAELYYSACASYCLLAFREGRLPQLCLALAENSADLPEFLQQSSRLQYAAYFSVPTLFEQLASCLSHGFDGFTSPFPEMWMQRLSGQVSERLRVVELGCGSANDFRAWSDCGLARWLSYTGVDVSSENINNAQARFPAEHFMVDDVCQLDLQSSDYDLVVAFDLYEHLSPSALLDALSETRRVTRGECWLSLFNASVTPSHAFRPVDEYHWNLLSIPELVADFTQQGFHCEAYAVAEIFESRFPGYRHYNPRAFILAAGPGDTTG